MKYWKYHMTLYGVLLLLILLTVIFKDSTDLCLVLLCVAMQVETVGNPVAVARLFKKSKLPAWLSSREKTYYRVWYAVVIAFWIFLFFVFPESINEFTDKDYVVLSVFAIVGVISGVMRRRILLHNAPENIGSVDDLLKKMAEK